MTPREAGYAIQLSDKTLLDVRPSIEHNKVNNSNICLSYSFIYCFLRVPLQTKSVADNLHIHFSHLKKYFSRHTHFISSSLNNTYCSPVLYNVEGMGEGFDMDSNLR